MSIALKHGKPRPEVVSKTEELEMLQSDLGSQHFGANCDVMLPEILNGMLEPFAAVYIHIYHYLVPTTYNLDRPNTVTSS